jgi:hypothetical protein
MSLAEELKKAADVKNVEKQNTPVTKIISEIVKRCKYASSDGKYETTIYETNVEMNEEARKEYHPIIRAELESLGFRIKFTGAPPFRRIIVKWK